MQSHISYLAAVEHARDLRREAGPRRGRSPVTELGAALARGLELLRSGRGPTVRPA
jgi:hypothetical protein